MFINIKNIVTGFITIGIIAVSFFQQTELCTIKVFFMPRTKNNGEISNKRTNRTVTGKTSPNVNRTAANKKQPPVNIEVPTARQRAKEFDEGRRHDAESNEL